MKQIGYTGPQRAMRPNEGRRDNPDITDNRKLLASYAGGPEEEVMSQKPRVQDPLADRFFRM